MNGDWNAIYAAIRDIGLPSVLLIILLFRLDKSLRELEEAQNRAREEFTRALQQTTLALVRLEELIRASSVSRTKDR